MVNYLYDLDKIEACHEQFMHGEVAHSRADRARLLCNPHHGANDRRHRP